MICDEISHNSAGCTNYLQQHHPLSAAKLLAEGIKMIRWKRSAMTNHCTFILK